MRRTLFTDRRHAGRVLAAALHDYAGRPDLLVLAIPRGGVPVGYEVARALQAPLDVLVVRKLGLPGQEEYAMGAIASGGLQVFNEEALSRLARPDAAVAEVVDAERHELDRRERLYRAGRQAADVHGRTVILVDDGLATGSSMLVALRSVRARHPARLVVAVPTASADSCERLRREADDVVCASTPEPFGAVGYWYEDFSQTGDEEVCALLRDARLPVPREP